MFIRPNLSPGPGYKIKERNSMFDSRNPNNEGEMNSKFVMVKPNEFCSGSNEQVKKKISQSNKRSSVRDNTSGRSRGSNRTQVNKGGSIESKNNIKFTEHSVSQKNAS